MTSTPWSTIPWVGSGATWHKRRVPYSADAHYLQTVDIWVPKDAHGPSSPASDHVPHRDGPWIIYIHGGAWRDPLVDSSSFEATALKLLSAQDSPIAGIASLNYPLSSHPKHPTHPSPPQGPSKPVDVARTVKHPDHIISVLSAISFLQDELGVAHNYVLSGHSCGATLAFQVVMNENRWIKAAASGVTIPRVKKPGVIVGLNGLYDLASFINNPPGSHKELQPLYIDFTKGAFGNDEQVWKAICPTSIDDWTAEWPEGRVVVVVQSKEDGLVPYSQTKLMKEHLKRTSKVNVIEMEAGGDHNDLWKQGDELAGIMDWAVRDYARIL